MAYPVASGQFDLTGTWKPIIFAKTVLMFLYMRAVLARISNTDYEGLISKQGDTVRIRELPEITIHDHVDGQELVTDHLVPGSQDLLIDKGKYWAFGLGAVEQKQSDLPMNTLFAAHASKQLALAIDKVVLQDIPSSVHASNAGLTAGNDSSSINLGVAGTPLVMTDSNALDILRNIGTILDEQDVPEDGRWVVLPAWSYDRIKTSDFMGADTAGDSVSILRTGDVKMINGFTIMKSRQLLQTPGDAAWSAMFGHKIGLTFAAQMVLSETLKHPFAFGDMLRSLNVFGFKVPIPEALGELYITHT